MTRDPSPAPAAMRSLAAVVLLLASDGLPSAAEPPPRDPLAQGRLAAPQELLAAADALALSADQRRQLRTLAAGLHREASALHGELRAAAAELEQVLATSPVDSSEAAAKLDRLLDVERQLKQLQLRTLAGGDHILSDHQRARVSELRGAAPREAAVDGIAAGAAEQRLTSKLERVRSEVQTRVSAGAPPHEVAVLMERFPPLMERGDLRAAEEVLDRALGLLGTGAGDPAAPAGEGGDDRPAEEGAHHGADGGAEHEGAAVDPRALREEIEALRESGVAWREIEWHTCLLAGLRASQQQHRPVVMWVFIDLPVDDKRC